MKACTGMTLWMGGDETLYVMICFSFSIENFVTLGTLFVAISSASSGVQKKESSDSVFESGDVDDVVIFDGKAFSFVFSISGIQKKDKSEMGFVRGDTGDEMTFMGGAIQRDLTC